MALLQVALARFTPHTRDRHCGAGLASRRRGVTPYLALWSPDFPRRLTPTRPSGLLSVSILDFSTALRADFTSYSRSAGQRRMHSASRANEPFRHWRAT